LAENEVRNCFSYALRLPENGSYDITDPQSLNRYSYVQNDPVNFEDPTGLYAACIHEAMTKFLAKLTGKSNRVANKLGAYAGDKPGGADSWKYSALNPVNIALWQINQGPNAELHFASEETLQRNIGASAATCGPEGINTQRLLCIPFRTSMAPIQASVGRLAMYTMSQLIGK